MDKIELDEVAIEKADMCLCVTCHPEKGALYDLRGAIRAYLSAAKSEPVAWVSAEQLDALPADDPVYEGGAGYLPVRRTKAGKFKLPLYTTPPAAKSKPVAVRALEPDIRDILNAVAHVGVDFGFGPYELDDTIIAAARDRLASEPANG